MGKVCSLETTVTELAKTTTSIYKVFDRLEIVKTPNVTPATNAENEVLCEINLTLSAYSAL